VRFRLRSILPSRVSPNGPDHPSEKRLAPIQPSRSTSIRRHLGRDSARLYLRVSTRQRASVAPPDYRHPAALWSAPDYPNTNSRPEAPMRTPVAENSYRSGDATTCQGLTWQAPENRSARPEFGRCGTPARGRNQIATKHLARPHRESAPTTPNRPPCQPLVAQPIPATNAPSLPPHGPSGQRRRNLPGELQQVGPTGT
jgi:hypothetical protein